MGTHSGRQGVSETRASLQVKGRTDEETGDDVERLSGESGKVSDDLGVR